MDRNRNRVIKFNSSTGAFAGEFGTSAGEGTLAAPEAVAVGSDGYVYVSNSTYSDDSGFRYVQKFSPTGTWVAGWGTGGTADGQVQGARGITIGPDTVNGGEAVFLADTGNNRIQVFSTTGTFRRKWSVTAPHSVGLFPGGTVLVSSNDLTFVQKYTNAGASQGDWASVSASDGNKISIRSDIDCAFINDLSMDAVYVLSTLGTCIGAIDSSRYSPTAPFHYPMGMTFG